MLLAYKGIWPKLHETVFVTEGARIIGDVEIGEHSSIWFNTVVRGDVHFVKIGKRTNVQDNSTLHVTKDTYPLVIGDDITIGHNVVLHGCTLKGKSLIGMGAIILDNAEVGEECIVGAGTLITEGTKIPPGSLVLGSPGKVVRQLKPEEKERVMRSASNYMSYVRNYLDHPAGARAHICEKPVS